jgi:hypothetical protein
MKRTFVRYLPVALLAFAFVASPEAHAKRAPSSAAKKAAKKECQQEQPGIKGRKLRACISQKLKNQDAGGGL